MSENVHYVFCYVCGARITYKSIKHFGKEPFRFYCIAHKPGITPGTEAEVMN